MGVIPIKLLVVYMIDTKSETPYPIRYPYFHFDFKNRSFGYANHITRLYKALNRPWYAYQS